MFFNVWKISFDNEIKSNIMWFTKFFLTWQKRFTTLETFFCFYCIWSFFFSPSTDDKNNIKLLNIICPSKTRLKHRKQLKCFLCIFMLLSINKCPPPHFGSLALHTHCLFFNTLCSFFRYKVFGFKLKRPINFYLGR